jgi:nucleoside-diphosphate-sugar epimerase
MSVKDTNLSGGINMKVMVNGATGLVGLSIIDAFLEDGHDVRGSDIPGANFSELEKRGVEIVPADLFDEDALGKSVEGMEVVVNVAGLFDLGASFELLDKINHQGTRNVCESVLKHAPNIQKVVQIASVGVYGKPVRVPCKEDDPKNPRNSYEKTKFLGEKAAFEYYKNEGLPVTSVRPTLVYGERSKYGHSMFVALFSMAKDRGLETVRGFRSGPMTSHVHVKDVGRAVCLVGTAPDSVGQSYNIADQNPVDAADFTRAIVEPLGLEFKPMIPYIPPLLSATNAVAPIIPLKLFEIINKQLGKKWDEFVDEKGLAPELSLRLDRDWIGYMTGDNIYDVSKLEALGMEWKYPNLIEGMKETIEWYREMEWLP